MGVTANSRTIVHQGDNLVNIAAPPDVCKTPTPGGPVPIPYVNIAMDSDLVKGAKKVKIEGNPVALEDSNLSMSSGDEPGVAGGLISNKFKGKMTWATSSSDVKAEGKGVVRFMDVTQHNGNSFNTAFMQLGGTGIAYGDDFSGPCLVCKKTADEHALLDRKEQSMKIALAIIEELKKRDDKWWSAMEKSGEDRMTTNPALRALSGHRREHSKGTHWAPYMVGVLVCPGGKNFAAVSDQDTPADFKDVVDKATAKFGGCEVKTKNATLDDMLKANARTDPESVRAVRRQWNTVVLKSMLGMKGFSNEPGTCAGAKLMATSGHTGSSMTELFYEPKASNNPNAQRPGVDVIHRPNESGDKPEARQRRKARRVDVEQPDKNEGVASCMTCQETLFMTRCEKTKDCVAGCPTLEDT